LFFAGLEEITISLKNPKIRFFYLNQIFLFFSIRNFAPTFYQIYETGVSAQSRKEDGHSRLASAISKKQKSK